MSKNLLLNSMLSSYAVDFDFNEINDAPSEDVILTNWKNSSFCMVSICMLTYNHCKFIRSALNGILSQETDFGFEILIHDDASTDGTADIVREYRDKYPNIIKPILQEVNQYSQGVSPSVVYNYPRANSKYVAMCEGDDCWIDKNKLRLQVELLEKNSQIHLSFHAAIRLDYSEESKNNAVIGVYSIEDSIIPFTHILHRTYGWIPFASCVIRQEAKKEFLIFMQQRPYLTIGDLYFQFFGAKGNGAVFLRQPMSLYRFATENSWTRKVLGNVKEKERHERAMLRSYVELDAETNYQYTENIKGLIIQRIFWLFNNLDDYECSGRDDVDPYYKLYLDLNNLILGKLQEMNFSSERYVIYGAGAGCGLIVKHINPEKIVCIIDRDGRRGKDFLGFPVDSIDNIERYYGNVLVISIFGQSRSSVEDLVEYNWNNQNRVVFFYYDLIKLIDTKRLNLDLKYSVF